MAKRRTAPKAMIETAKSRRHHRQVMAWVKKREQLRPPALIPDEPLRSKLLEQPGKLEQFLRGIKHRFVQADQRRRTAIDLEVMRCFRVARLLNANVRKAEHILGGKWLAHWRKHRKLETEALRFVFLQTHADPKKASFYFRALYTMFEEDVAVEDIPARVTAGGGYEALAVEHKRFPRSGPRGAANSGRKPKPGKPKAEDDGDRDDEQSKPTDAVERSDEGDATHEPTSKVTLFATFDEDGQSFINLPLPCFATVAMYITAGPGDTRTVVISHAEQVA